MTPPIAGQSPAALPQGGAASPAVAPPVFRMVAPGGVNQTFQSGTEAQAAAKAYSSPEALNARFVAAYRGAGQLDKAHELENSFKRGQMADLQFSEAQKATIAKDADASLRAAVGGGASSLSAFANQSGLFGKGAVGFDTGKDGRLQFYSLGADGTKAMLGQPVENTQEALSGLVSPHWKSLYPRHMEFFALGARCSERVFMAGNRVGKTVAAGTELAYHLAGRYPSWWAGHRFSKPVRALISGDTHETMRDILQLKLLGSTTDKPENFGTGLIPGDAITGIVARTHVKGAVERAG